jgi:hypothetical protein
MSFVFSRLTSRRIVRIELSVVGKPTLASKETERVARLEREAASLRKWLAANPTDRPGVRGGVRKSNRTDNESARMATGNGVILRPRLRLRFCPRRTIWLDAISVVNTVR